MKKKFPGLLLAALCLMLCTVLPVRADHFEGAEGWQVRFTNANEMVENFTKTDIVDAVSGLQPGDSITFKVAVKNENEETTSWYMSNRVLSSLEDSSKTNTTRGGAYTYTLVYVNAAGEEDVLFDSDTLVGNDDSSAGRGLKAVSPSLQDYFFLDDLVRGQSGTIVLDIALDGETQGNAYQNTLADLQMNFAVELRPDLVRVNDTGSGNTTRRTTIVRTSDDTNLLPLYIAMGITGVLILILAIYSIKGRKEENKEDGKK